MIKALLSFLRISRLKWHDLKSVEPVSRTFGLDRGTPIDRYYIEAFLNSQRELITGHVLEIAESRYSKEFGHNISSFEVLHVQSHPKATIVGDLTQPSTLPADRIDCFICTQVFNFIFDFERAIEGAYHVLKPGGVLLATVAGISQVSRYDADRWGHFWSFYPQGIQRSFENVFGKENVKVTSYGNSLSAIAFLKGLACDELSADELDYYDRDYPVSISIVAKKSNQ
jgi:hypothetical protein